MIFATTMIALGIVGLCKGDFTTIMQPVPKGLPGRETLVYLCNLISVASGIGLLWQRTATIAARLLLLWFLLWLLLLRLPGFFRGFTVDVYWPACQTSVMLPWHSAWAYLTGATFIAAGVALIIGLWARLAAALSTLQMGLFLLVVWIPKMAAGSMTAFQWGEVVITWALTSAGWVVTDSYRGTPWLAAKQRRV